jgi:hypothetical protein
MGWGLAAALRRGDVSPIGLAAWTGRGPLLTPNRLDSEMQEVVTLADHPSMSARGSNSEVWVRNWEVRFALNNGHRQPDLSGPKRARTRHAA